MDSSHSSCLLHQNHHPHHQQRLFKSPKKRAMASFDHTQFSIIRSAFEIYPCGVVMAKGAPPCSEGRPINYETDFCYFYFSPCIERLSQLNRHSMCIGDVNAKRDFPDFVSYFDIDIKVVREFTDNRIFSICEPWAPPGIDSFAYTRKTAIESRDRQYMLCCFDVVDDVALGVAKFRRIASHNAMSVVKPLTLVYSHEASNNEGVKSITTDTDSRDAAWFCDAFESLPNGMIIVDYHPSSSSTATATMGISIRCANYHWNHCCHLFADTSNDSEASVKRLLDMFEAYGVVFDPKTASTTAAWLTSIVVSPSTAVGVTPVDAVDICAYGLGPHTTSDSSSNSSNNGSSVDGSGVSIVFVMRPTLKATLKGSEGYAAMSSRITL